MQNVPHYLRFVRALAIVSATLPVPLVLVAAHLAACGGSTSGSSEAPAPGVTPCGSGCASGHDGGVLVPPDSGPVGDASPSDDGSLEGGDDGGDGGDASDDGGGPSRGTPELPASWLA